MLKDRRYPAKFARYSVFTWFDGQSCQEPLKTLYAPILRPLAVHARHKRRARIKRKWRNLFQDSAILQNERGFWVSP